MKEIIIQGCKCRPCLSQPNYAISECSKIFRISTGKEMVQTLRGVPEYLTIRACQNNIAKNVKVHIMVAEVWLEEPKSPLYDTVNHKDGDKLNNHVSNLEWATKSQNSRHAVNLGLIKSGEDCYQTKLTGNNVHEICKMLSECYRIKDIADRFDVSNDIIRKIKAGDAWFDIRVLYPIQHVYSFTPSESTVRWVCEKINEGYSDKAIANMSRSNSVSCIEVKRIRYKIRFKMISDEYF